MKNLKYVVLVAGIALVALLVTLSPNIGGIGKAAPEAKGTISRRGLNTIALSQSAPRAEGIEELSVAPGIAAQVSGATGKVKGAPKKDGGAMPEPSKISAKNAPPRAGIEDSDVRVELQLDPLKMGGAYAQTYKADFAGDYVIKNLQDQGSKLTFYFPFPPNSGTMYDVMLQIKGQEPKDVLYSGQGIRYSDTFASREERPIHITYKAYGMGSYNYGLEHDRRVRKLHVVVEVKGTETVNLANDVLMPTDRKTGAGGQPIVGNSPI